MTDRRCPCGGLLVKEAEVAHGVCNRCRVDSKKPRRQPPPKPDFVDVPMFDVEPAARRLVPLDGAPMKAESPRRPPGGTVPATRPDERTAVRRRAGWR